MNNSPSFPCLGSPHDHQQLQEQHALLCPRCNSNTNFCYSDHSLARPIYFCESCRRYCTVRAQILLPPQVLNTTTDVVLFPSLHGTSSAQHEVINSGASRHDYVINMPDQFPAPRIRSYPGLASRSHSHIQHLAQLVSLHDHHGTFSAQHEVINSGASRHDSVITMPDHFPAPRTRSYPGLASRSHSHFLLLRGEDDPTTISTATALPTPLTRFDNVRQLRANERNEWPFPLLDPSAATAVQVGLVLAQIYRGSGSQSLLPHAMALLYISFVLEFIGFTSLQCAQFLSRRRNRENAARLLQRGGILATAFGFIAAMGMIFPEGYMVPVTIFSWVTCSLASFFACTF